MKKKLIVTGSCGLIGSETVRHFCKLGWEVIGFENNGRREFFGKDADISPTRSNLENLTNYYHLPIDIKDRENVIDLVRLIKPDAVVHCAAQPSHDLAAKIPFLDFDTNAGGTLNMLEAVRQYGTDIPFVHMSTNKVYGDVPNEFLLLELEKRYDFRSLSLKGIGFSEDLEIDHCKHSLFGASKLAADIYVQEYGRYFDMPTVCLRGGCLTGPNHAGVELHGFLNYLVKCNAQEKEYTIFGYKGKQVRDNIHAWDVANFIHRFIEEPKVAAVYNIGGGYENSCSILEAIEMTEEMTGKKMITSYVDKPREGDHICYYSDLTKIKTDYPGWGVTRSLPQIIQEINTRNV
jgi:CDP-paratose 2-epimerase